MNTMDEREYAILFMIDRHSEALVEYYNSLDVNTPAWEVLKKVYDILNTDLKRIEVDVALSYFSLEVAAMIRELAYKANITNNKMFFVDPMSQNARV